MLGLQVIAVLTIRLPAGMGAHLVEIGASTVSQSVQESSAAGCCPAHRRHKLAPIVPFLGQCPRVVGIWAERRHQRRALAELDDRRLKDVGLSRERTRREAAKPFWKP